ncbi:GGDEF domain-containing protein [Secundilactobacillus muriivasis]
MHADDSRASLLADVGLLLFLTVISLTVVLAGITHQLWLNACYMGITLVVMLVTYFFGIVPGLLGNLLFVLGQTALMVAVNWHHAGQLPLTLSFWLVVPGLLSGTLAMMMTQQQQLQANNDLLRTQLTERGAFDLQTNLRTTVAYVADARVFIENHRRFQLPVTMVVFRIRYYHELQQLISEQQLQTLLAMTSNTLTTATRDNDVTYYLDNQLPTWGTILYADAETAAVAIARIKRTFATQLLAEAELKSLDTTLVSGVASWNPETMANPYDLMNESVREMEFDVGQSGER